MKHINQKGRAREENPEELHLLPVWEDFYIADNVLFDNEFPNSLSRNIWNQSAGFYLSLQKWLVLHNFIKSLGEIEAYEYSGPNAGIIEMLC